MLGKKYKLPKLFKHLLISLPLILSFLTITPIISQPAYAATSTKCATPNSSCNCNTSTKLTKDNCGIIYYLWLFINILAGLVGLVAVASIIFGGIQYAAAGDDPQKISAAKARIANTLLALAVFIFMYAFLQWLVPGGVL